MQHPVKMYYAADRPYPVEIRGGRGHYIFTTLACLFALGVILVFMSAMAGADRQASIAQHFNAIKELEATGIKPEIVPEAWSTKINNTIIYSFCIALAALISLTLIASGIWAFKNPVIIKFDQRGVLVLNNSLIKLEDMRINWSDVSSVDIYSYERLLHHKNRTVDLILHDNKIFKRNAVQDISHHSSKARKIKHNLRGVIRLNYTGEGMGFSHDEYFEFIKSELSKYQSNNPVKSPSSKQPMRPSKRLFG